MGMMPSYLSISLIAAQSHNHQKCCPQRRCLFWPISHIPHAVSPTNELYFLSKSIHDQYQNAKGLNRAPFLLRSKIHSPVLHKSLIAHYNSSSSTVCIKVHPMPYTLQSFWSKVGVLGSNLAKNGEYFTPFSVCWIIPSILAYKKSMELDSCQIVLGFFVMASCVFQILEHFCDINWLIESIRINLTRLLLTSSHLFYQISIVQGNFHLLSILVGY